MIFERGGRDVEVRIFLREMDEDSSLEREGDRASCVDSSEAKKLYEIFK